MFEYGDDIVGQKLSQVEGVSQAIIGGAAKSAVRVQINPGRAGLDRFEPGGRPHHAGAGQRGSAQGQHGWRTRPPYAITSNDQLLDAEDYRIAHPDAKTRQSPIKLNSLGKVIEGVENTRLGRLGRHEPRRAGDRLQTSRTRTSLKPWTASKPRCRRFKQWLPPVDQDHALSDRTTTIRASVKDVQFSLLLSIALVVMVIFLFLRRFWPTFIASITCRWRWPALRR